jgi:adenine-specific DNA methylase
MPVRVRCPRCGREGKLVKHTVHAKGRVYVYTAVKHVENGRVRRCIVGRERADSAAEAPSYDDVLEALSYLYSLARARAQGGDREELERFLVWVEHRLNPLIARMYEEASAILEQKE